jgi:hypothetical protein
VNVSIDLTKNQVWTPGAQKGSAPADSTLVRWMGIDPQLGKESATLQGDPPSEASSMNVTAVSGGFDPNLGSSGQLYPCRAVYNGVQLGKAFGNHWCSFPYGGKEIFQTQAFEVLATPSTTTVNWVTGAGSIPAHALAAGFDGADTLYVCRGRTPSSTNWVPGKTKVGWGTCDVSGGGSEVFYTTYQILTVQ